MPGQGDRQGFRLRLPRERGGLSPSRGPGGALSHATTILPIPAGSPDRASRTNVSMFAGPSSPRRRHAYAPTRCPRAGSERVYIVAQAGDLPAPAPSAAPGSNTRRGRDRREAGPIAPGPPGLVPNLVDHLYSNQGIGLKDAVLRQPTEFVARVHDVADEQRAWREGSSTTSRPHDDDLSARPRRPAAPVQPGGEQLRPSVRSLPTLRLLQPDGYLIGDGILYTVAEEMVLVGRSAGHNWVRSCAQTAGGRVGRSRRDSPTIPPAGAPCTGIKWRGRRVDSWERLTGAPFPRCRGRTSSLSRSPAMRSGPAAHHGRGSGVRVLRALG